MLGKAETVSTLTGMFLEVFKMWMSEWMSVWISMWMIWVMLGTG